MRRLGFAALVASLLLAVLLAFPSALWALTAPVLVLFQGDTVVAVHDKTGIFGGLIDHYFGAIVAAIQSGLVFIFTKSSAKWRGIPEPLKWGFLYLVGFGLTWVSLKTGFGGVKIDGNALTTAGVLASVPTLASGLIFKLGGHNVTVQRP